MDDIAKIAGGLSAAARKKQAERFSSHLPPTDYCGQIISNADIDAMKAAFIKRFDEPLPRTETLFAVAAIGYRMAVRDYLRIKNDV